MLVALIPAIPGLVLCQFVDNFENDSVALDNQALNGWAYYYGDGNISMNLSSKNDYATVRVDATSDTRNIWYALIRRQVSENLDLALLNTPAYELRVETRIKVSHAPRRVNLSLNTQRTTNFLEQLMEFDIADTSQWHTISFTTMGMDAEPGDTVYGQLALMDWGLEQYTVDIDYYSVAVIHTGTAGPDYGAQVVYHPPVADTGTFKVHLPVLQSAMINSHYPDMNFSGWYASLSSDKSHVLTVGGSQYIILRWDVDEFATNTINTPGLLELTTHSLQRSATNTKDFGMVRIVEILGGKADWSSNQVTQYNFCSGQSLNQVLNLQTIIDLPVSENQGDKTYFTISVPVMRRLITGKTRGLAVLPLGALQASFFPHNNQKKTLQPVLHFTVE
jgi:hypothetical protein